MIPIIVLALAQPSAAGPDTVHVSIPPRWEALLGCRDSASAPLRREACEILKEERYSFGPDDRPTRQLVRLLAPHRSELSVRTDTEALLHLELVRREEWIASQGNDGVVSCGHLLAAARALAARTSDVAVQERATIYVVSCLGGGYVTDTREPKLAFDETIGLLRRTQDPVVAESARFQLVSIPGRDFYPARRPDLEFLLATCRDTQMVEIAHWGLRVSELVRPEQRPEWVECARTAIAGGCGAGSTICEWLRENWTSWVEPRPPAP